MNAKLVIAGVLLAFVCVQFGKSNGQKILLYGNLNFSTSFHSRFFGLLYLHHSQGLQESQESHLHQ